MILPRDELKELQRLGSLEVVVDKPPAAEIVAVQSAVGIAAVCRVRVTDSWAHQSGGFVLILEVAETLKPQAPRQKVRRDTVRLMKRGHGETDQLQSAWRDNTCEDYDDLLGRAPEPEMVDKDTERRFSAQAHSHHSLRDLEAQRRTLLERLDRTIEGAERLNVDATREIAAIERRVDQLEKKLRRAA